jgi:hypothetical protein
MQKRPSKKTTTVLALLGTAALLSACQMSSRVVPTMRTETAKRIAMPAHLVEAHIPAGEFTIMAFERVEHRGKPAIVYIEDDGAVHGSDWSIPDADPTPTEPVALRMAADDTSTNVVYLARPCQFSGAMGTRPCTPDLFTSFRYSPQAIDAMGAALDNVKHRYGIPSFTLVGYHGGAAIAVELAATRKDITFLRTIGGVLDTSVLTRGMKVNPLSGSLNPLDAAPAVAHIPQQHSYHAWAPQMTAEMIHNFLAAEGNPATATVEMAPDAAPAGKAVPAPAVGMTPLPPQH